MKGIKIKVVGVGGSGGNAIHRMSKTKQKEVTLVAINSDLQDLKKINADIKVQIGQKTTKGFGCGMNPKLGELSAKEQAQEIENVLKNTELVFITCGLGGGTGSGAAPIIAEIAKNKIGALTIGIVTMPFSFEGKRRREIAKRARLKLLQNVDALIVVENDNLLKIIKENVDIEKAFLVCDRVLNDAVMGIIELIKEPGLINVDLNDVKEILKEAGYAVLGIGEAEGKEKIKKTVQEVVSSPLLNYSLQNAKRLLFNIFADRNLTLKEVHTIAQKLSQYANPSAKIIFGTTFWNKNNSLRIVLVASGLN
jgi:cell division protein FtsZ